MRRLLIEFYGDVYGILLILTIFCCALTIAFMACSLVTLSLIAVRYPIALLAEVMFRIATFHKGAWAALVFIGTVVLGLVKLFVH